MAFSQEIFYPRQSMPLSLKAITKVLKSIRRLINLQITIIRHRREIIHPFKSAWGNDMEVRIISLCDISLSVP